ncbi:TylF/MycF/NovP-related O-methyltransferase [Pseudodesulfovibrio methanolicus]|uniref:TylF/MycF/NovP-related O-methyltransferase n=1 Tax=Pseudodesulfovibrio methanolicus TaxID=3126690 RepID=A0ABZ2J2A9_9BACT
MSKDLTGIAVNEEDMVTYLRERGYVVEKVVGPGEIPDRNNYRPYVNPWTTFLPWVGREDVFSLHRELAEKGAASLVGSDRMWTLRTCLEQVATLDGEVWEMGVYKGGTGLLFKKELLRLHPDDTPRLRLFDTFEGMPEVEAEVDCHQKGDFDDTSLETVRRVVGDDEFIRYHQGFIPATFAGLDGYRIKLAHVDVDIHRSVLDCCEFVYPRLVPGGAMVFDDYGIHTCPGARRAVDEYFGDKPECPLILPTGQAVVFRLP